MGKELPELYITDYLLRLDLDRQREKLSSTASEGVKVYRVEPELHGLGVVTLPTKMG